VSFDIAPYLPPKRTRPGLASHGGTYMPDGIFAFAPTILRVLHNFGGNRKNREFCWFYSSVVKIIRAFSVYCIKFPVNSKPGIYCAEHEFEPQERG
jgi:hypothetical protein